MANSQNHTSWQADENIFNGIVKSTSQTNEYLPPLAKEKSEAGEAFSNWLLETLKPFLEFMQNNVGEGLSGSNIKSFIYIIIVILCIWLIYVLVKSFYNRKIANKDLQKKYTGQFSSKLPSKDILERDIQQAITNNDFSKACRLRWILFLVQSKVPDHITPYEYINLKIRNPQKKNTLISNFSDHYKSMYLVAESIDPYNKLSNDIGRLNE